MSNQDDSDEYLIENYLSGDENFLKLLIDKYTPIIFNFSARLAGLGNATDITQDIFIKVWRNLKKFKKNKASFKTWLFAIARNTIIDYLRKKKYISFSKIETIDEYFVDNLESDYILPDEYLMKLQDIDLLNELLEKLPINYKEILTLYYEEDMTFKEIGILLNKPINTIKSHHRRALMQLKELIAPKL